MHSKFNFSRVSRIARQSILIGISMVLLLSSSGCYLFPKEKEVIAPPLVKPVEVTYDTMDAEKSDMKIEVNASGNFVYIVQQDLAFRDSGGPLKALYVKIGDEVKKGQLIAELDTETLKDDIEQQKIALDKAITAHDSAVSNGKQDIKLAELKLKELQDNYDKMTSISKDSNGIPEDSIYSQEEIDTLKDQIEEQRIAFDKLKEQYGEGGYVIKQTEQDIESAQLKLKQMQQGLAESKLVSPLAGMVMDIDSNIKLGQFMAKNTTFITIADERQLQLRCTGDNISSFEFGMKVKVEISGIEYEGTVVSTPGTMSANEKLSSTDDPNIKVAVKALPADVKVGDPADISVVLKEKKGVIVLPKDVVHDFDGQKVVDVLENGHKKERNVETGLETVTDYEIVKGVQVGEKIIK